MADILTLVAESLAGLEVWITKNGWAGWDPYSVKGHPLFLRFSRRNSSLLNKLIRYGLSQSARYYPGLWLRLLRCPHKINPKGMALLAKAYFVLYGKTGDRVHLEKARACLTWLRANPSPGYQGFAWGYPFDWQSAVFVPENTPSAVVSYAVAEAFWLAFKTEGKAEDLNICESICDFFLRDLYRHVLDRDRLCFSYTPLDRTHILNATLFVGEFLHRIGRYTGRQEYVSLGLRAVNYVVSEQSPDGSWPYAGREDGEPVSIDHCHTGFILRTLGLVCRDHDDRRFVEALEKGKSFYLSRFFGSDTLPKDSPDRLYPINIHSVSEAILTLAFFTGPSWIDDPRLRVIVPWAIWKMQDKRGYFYYLKTPWRTVRTPFLRWSQAWMLLALSVLLSEGRLPTAKKEMV